MYLSCCRMAETDAEIILLLVGLLLLALANKIQQNYSTKKKKRRIKSGWVRPWLMECAEKGACSNIFNHLKLREFEHFRYYSRMNTESFQHLLELVTTLIKKKITPMRVPIYFVYQIKPYRSSFQM